MRSTIKVLFVFMILFSKIIYADKLYNVLPWSGYKAAISLTFDDGDPVHLDFAIPEMQKRNIRGTFFLIADKTERIDEWKKAAESGMEIGNHSSNHKHAYELSKEEDIIYEVENAEKFLQNQFNQPVISFAYPFIEITNELLVRVKKNCIIARGGGTGELYYTPDSAPDWYNIHSQTTMSDYDFETYKAWIDTAFGASAWTVFMIHAIEGSNWWQPIPKDVFIKILDYLKKNENIWVAPFGEIGAYWQAQKIIENAKVIKTDKNYLIRWKKPQLFPEGVFVKIKINNDDYILTQKGVEIKQTLPYIYPISFDSCEFILEKRKKSGKIK